MHIDIRDLAALMPMHVCLDQDGNILSCGRIVARILNGRRRMSDAFVHIGEDGQETALDAMLAQISTGQRVFLNLRARDDIYLRGHGVRNIGGFLLLNMGFGASLAPAIRAFELTDLDFSSADLAMEFLFLHEANKAALSELSRVNKSLKAAREDAQRMSITDPLTGVLNRRGFDLAFLRAMEQRASAPFSLIHLDLDHFKQVNDRLGHAAGDRVLQRAADSIRAEVRASDKVCRAGGDEFLILMFSTTDQDLLKRACSRIIQRIEAMESAPDAPRVSASIGVAICPTDRMAGTFDLFERADRALYQAKETGRGQVIVWQDPAAPFGDRGMTYAR